MNEKPKKKRDRPFQYRPPVKLRSTFEEAVERSGLNVNAFITQLWTEKPAPKQARRSTLGEQLAGKILGLMGQIKDDTTVMRQEVSELNNDSQKLDEIHDELEKMNERLLEIRWALFKLLGRKP